VSGVETVAVRAEDADQRLDRWLRRRFPGLTQGRIEKLLRTGQIRLDGKRVEARERVYAGQEVRLPPNLDAPARPPRAAVDGRDAEFVRALVIHEDDDVIALDKPSGLAVQGGTGTARHLDGMLDALADGGERPRLVHRLDRDTSGVLVLAKDETAAKDLMAQFEDRTVAKSYLALTVGAPQPPSGTVEFQVSEDPKRPGRMEIVARKGRVCVSDYETLDAWRAVSLVRVRPKTGRTHQVRLTLLLLGTPCAIDPLYGSQEPLLLSSWKQGYRLGKGRREAPLIDRLTLHAESLEFRRPGAAADDSAARVRVEAPPPRDFETAVRQLRRWGAAGTL
jgi:23S rRNA pseudouridine955/2504/2580 synthase